MSSRASAPPVSVIIPACNERARIGATVAAAQSIPGVAEVLVVDDGSTDSTADEAVQAGAAVISIRHRGKGAALRRGVTAAHGELLLFLDADLGDSARAAETLVAPVRDGRADMTIAVLPSPSRRPGFGIALRAARVALWLLTGRWFAAPLSGQRCMTAKLARSLPWARGFAAEVAATADAAAMHARIAEVPAAITHAPTGRTVAGFIHRGKQFAAVLAAFIPRAFYPIGPTPRPAPGRRIILAACAWAVLISIIRLAQPAVWDSLGNRLAWALDAAATAAAFAVAVTVASLAVVHWAGILRPNYRGKEVPAAAGLGFLLGPWAACGLALRWGDPRADLLALSVMSVTAMSLAGLADDVYGSREISGLAGHFGRLARGHLTTGAVKALVGLMIGAVTGWLLARPSVPGAILNAAVIVLCANAVNLLDLRPGRALKGFLGLALLAVVADPRALYLVGPIGVMALAFAPLDLSGRAMMGDVGSNALGIMAGIALALALPLWAKLVAAAVLVGLHACTERHSLSDLIARVPALRWLDYLGRGDENGAG